MSDRLNALREFQDNAGCIHSHRKAIKAWRGLKPHLTEKQRMRLRIEWNHHEIGEGRGGLDEACERVRREWSSE